MTLAGTAVLDIAQHFIERWNEVKKRKVCLSTHRDMNYAERFPQYKTDTNYDWLAFPHNVNIAPNEPIVRESPSLWLIH